jgi:hypothetical protein
MGSVGPHWSKSAPANTHAAIEAIVVAVADAFIGASIPNSLTLDVRVNLEIMGEDGYHTSATD